MSLGKTLGKIDLKDIAECTLLDFRRHTPHPRRRRAQIGLQGLAVDHVNRSVKQSCYIILQSDIVEQSDMGIGIDIDHNIDVAIGPDFAASDGAEHGCVRNPPRAQVAFMSAKNGKRFLSIHA